MPYSRILIGTEQLEDVVSHLARKLHSIYKNIDNCLALVVLDGAKYFAKDLLAKLDLPFEVEYIKASSYSGTHSSGIVKTDKIDTLRERVRGKNILLIDDIYDTGMTLSHILGLLNSCNPKTVKTCVLLEKKIEHTKKINLDFLGTKIENVFVIGYGLDFEGQYRELPFIGELSDECIRQNALARKA